MMFTLMMGGASDLAVMRISAAVRELGGIMIADGNAARKFTAFWGPEDGVERLDSERVFAEYWTDPDPVVKDEKKRVKCAEVLVPDSVPPGYITGVYVQRAPSAAQEGNLRTCGFEHTISEHMFFLGPKRLGAAQ